MRRLPLFLILIISVVGLCGYYLGRRILVGSPFLSLHPTGVWVSVAAFLSFVILGPMLSRLLPEKLNGRFYPLRWSLNMTMAVFFTLLFYTFATDLVLYGAGFFLTGDVSARLQEWSLPLIAALVVGTLVIGALQALAPKVYRVTVPLQGLPREFDGFKIAQISDLHIGEMIGHEYVNHVVDKTNSLKPDVIAMTGDIIDGHHRLTAPVSKNLSKLTAPDGVFYVTGNHEYYWGVHHALQQVEAAGIKILMNENVLIEKGGSQIAIAGVSDISSSGMSGKQKSDPVRSVLGVAKETIKILLAHQPVSFRGALQAGIHLQLSGHTHGGQFFPWSLVVRLFQHYNKGLIRHDHLWIYVNRGTATWGPRLRFGIPPEITLLTLTPA